MTHNVSTNGDRWFTHFTHFGALTVIGLLTAIIILLTWYSLGALETFGFQFLTGSKWNPVPTPVNPVTFGALPYIYGTVITSVIGVAIALPLALGSAIFLTHFAPRRLVTPVSFVIEFLASVPSIAFGMWGLFVLVPFMRSTVDPFLINTLGRLPILNEIFKGPTFGQHLLSAGIILAMMILPTILSISREVIAQVPRLQKEAMSSLGATKWEVIRYAVLPFARSGIIGATLLGLARAIGETMAVTMVIGNSTAKITGSLFTPGYTIASAIANQFTEADTELYFSAIIALALVLLLVGSLFNVLSRLMIRLTKVPPGVQL